MSDTRAKTPAPADETPGETCRRLIRSARSAALATLAGDDAADEPYASLVLVAAAQDGCPILLLSDLADHSRNIARDDRVSLLFDDTADLADPLTGARVSVQGRARPLDGKDRGDPLLRRYLARHPEAEGYVDFTDFRLYDVIPERAHLVAGFGRIHWIDATDLLLDVAASAALAAAEPDILDHMNADHADALQAYAASAIPDAGDGWVMTGIDPEGLDLCRDGQFLRVGFKKRVDDATAAREILSELARQARQGIGGKRAG
jgi:putative heme iron utilization protein